MLIAIFGGVAGIIGITRKEKYGNVIPGVAIATALMPPLCTAGYGLARGQWSYFTGALYLFFINSFFIGLTAVVALRVMKVPYVKLESERAMKKSRRFITFIACILILPSIFSAKKVVNDAYTDSMFSQYMDEAKYILNQDQILSSSIDKDEGVITILVYGETVDDARSNDLNTSLARYDLNKYYINLIQLEASGRVLSSEDVQGIVSNELLTTSNDLQSKIDDLQKQIDTLQKTVDQTTDASKEISDSIYTLYPKVTSFEGGYLSSGSQNETYLARVTVSESLSADEKTQMTAWMKKLLNTDAVEIEETVQ